jgi:hypothetical protein
MRRPIGWVDKEWPDGKRQIRVEFFADDVKWRFRLPEDDCWQDGAPTPEYWDELEAKLLELKQRGHLFDKEIALVRKLKKGK